MASTGCVRLNLWERYVIRVCLQAKGHEKQPRESFFFVASKPSLGGKYMVIQMSPNGGPMSDSRVVENDSTKPASTAIPKDGFLKSARLRGDAAVRSRSRSLRLPRPVSQPVIESSDDEPRGHGEVGDYLQRFAKEGEIVGRLR